MPSYVAVIDTVQDLSALMQEMARHSSVAVDMESDNFHRYPERVCLVQIAAAGRAYLLDPLALDDVSSLGRFLADVSVEKVFHSADYDIRSLDREWGFRLGPLFDTSIAAAFLGIPKLGLGNVLQELLGVSIPKEKSLQRADWGRRPLDASLLDYAASDVLHLLALKDVLVQRLSALGRMDWVAEECARLTRVRYNPVDPERAVFSMKGARVLNPKSLALLKALVDFRRGEALRLRRPPFRVMPDSALVQLGSDPAADLAHVPGLGRYGRDPASVRKLRDAIDAGSHGPPLRRPPPVTPLLPRPTEEEQRRLQKLKEWRTEQGKHLELDPALLWPAPSLERLSRDLDTLDAELQATEVRQWQAKAFSQELSSFLKGLRSAT